MVETAIRSEVQGRSKDILLVEDDPDDIKLMTETISGSGSRHRLHVVSDGSEVLSYLRQEGKHKFANRPALIILDLKLQKSNGHAVLRDIKYDDRLRRIPVVILTTSDSERDVFMAYDHHANCFLTKPSDLDQYIKLSEWIEDWLAFAQLSWR